MRWRLSLRAKLLLASGVLVVLPYLGYRYVNEVEAHLRAGLEGSLRDAASVMAGVLDEQEIVQTLAQGIPALTRGSEATPPRTEPNAAPRPNRDSDPSSGTHLLVHNLTGTIQLDGYPQDWRAKGLAAVALASTDPERLEVRYTAARDSTHLYLLVEVVDPALVYAREATLGSGRADHLVLHTAGTTTIGTHVRERLVIETVSAGWAGAHRRAPRRAPERDYRVRAQWHERTGGYVVELRLPLDMVSEGVAIAVVDVRELPSSAPSSPAPPMTSLPPESPSLVPMQRFEPEAVALPAVRPAASAGAVQGPAGSMVVMSREIEAVLAALDRVEGQRVRVLDRHARIRAQHGQLRPLEVNADGWRAGERVLRWLIGEPTLSRPGPGALGKVIDPMVQAALAGRAGVSWQGSASQGDATVRAAHPIRLAGDIAGVVLIERTANTIQTVRRTALTDVMVQTLLAALLVVVAFAWFATRLAGRLARLRDQASGAIDAQGRVVGAITPSPGADEIGDLGRSVHGMLERLRRYNEYLELLAQRLTHELRTPIALIRSSLDNLEQAEAHRAPLYTARAKEGLERLDAILARMAEATRLEQTLRSGERERFDLAELVRAVVAGYRQVWPHAHLRLEIDSRGPMELCGMPELLVQALDKLVSNAIDFGLPQEAVTIRVYGERARAVLEVDNLGPPIPSALGERIFDSMVSGREGEPGEPHLGLGLYIVRLVVESHQGEIEARSRPDGRGVVFRLRLPRA